MSIMTILILALMLLFIILLILFLIYEDKEKKHTIKKTIYITFPKKEFRDSPNKQDSEFKKTT